MLLSENISDADLLRISPELKKRIRKIENLGPIREIKIKNNPNAIKSHIWNCKVADELIKLAIKCENRHEHEHDVNYCEASSRIIRMARDLRYATTYSRYQAIVIAAEHTRSLKDLAGDEAIILTRWEVDDNEKACRECIDLFDCRATKCKHICHQFRKEMTTKGIKWAMRETEELAILKKQMIRLADDKDDLCDLMKIVLLNPRLKMTMGDKNNLMARHIKIDDCNKCLLYTSEHPNYLREHLDK